MAKFSGLGMSLTVEDSGGSPVNIAADVGSLVCNTVRGEQDVTGIDKSAMERLDLLEDSDVQFSGNGFPPATTRAVFEELDNEREVVIGYPDSATFTLTVRLFSYNINRGQDGGLSWQATGKLSNGSKGVWS